MSDPHYSQMLRIKPREEDLHGGAHSADVHITGGKRAEATTYVCFTAEVQMGAELYAEWRDSNYASIHVKEISNNLIPSDFVDGDEPAKYAVKLENDDVNTFQAVADALQKFCNLSKKNAWNMANKVHNAGEQVVFRSNDEDLAKKIAKKLCDAGLKAKYLTEEDE